MWSIGFSPSISIISSIEVSSRRKKCRIAQLASLVEAAMVTFEVLAVKLLIAVKRVDYPKNGDYLPSFGLNFPNSY